jgi:hypothetical protein
MPTLDKDGIPIMFLETCLQGESGFYMDGTAGTPYAQQLRTPAIEWIATTGMEVIEEVTKDINGKEVRKKMNRRIRHIKDCDTIYPEEQDKRGFVPNRNSDKIIMENGFITIKDEGSTANTFKYLLAATYFADNPLRPATATKRYREIKINERAVAFVDDDELLTAAKAKVYALRLSTGEKGKYKYNQDKINSYCNLLDIVELSPETQIFSLIENAKRDPKTFLNTVVKAEQTVVTEISHALQLDVIMFDGNNAQYTKESKVITSLGTLKMSNNKKIEALADYLQTPEGNNDLTELRTKLEVEKERQFSK